MIFKKMTSLRDIKRKIRTSALALLLLSAATLLNAAPKHAWAQKQEQRVVVPFLLLTPDGVPLRNASIMVAYKAQLPDSTRSGTGIYQTDDKGQLEFPDAVPNSNWEFTFWMEGVGFETVKDLKIAQSPTEAKTVHLQSGVTFRVRCAENTRPVPKPLGNISMILQRLDVEDGTIENVNGYEFYRAQTSDGDGIAEFAAVPQGTYILKTGRNYGFDSFAEAVEVDGSYEKAVFLDRAFTAGIQLKVVDSDNQPVVDKTFSLRTNYAPKSDSMQLSEKKRVSVAEAVQWNKELRFWPNGYPLPLRNFRTNEKGEATIYPMDVGRWKLALFATNPQQQKDSISEENTILVSSGITRLVVLKLKPNAN